MLEAVLVGHEGEVIGSECDAHELDDFERLYAGEELKSRIDIQIGSALDIFAATDGMFDVVLIDIDKEGYSAALEVAIPRVRKGGLILADNVLWGGAVVDKENNDRNTTAIRNLNLELLDDPRVDISLVPIGDGLTIARKK